MIVIDNEKALSAKSITFMVTNQMNIKQVRTNIGLTDTLIPSSFEYSICMGGTGPCCSMKIIFSNHVYSEHTILNIRFGASDIPCAQYPSIPI